MSALALLGLILVILGFILAFIAAIMMLSAGVRAHGKVRGGGLIMIGPVPIIFGTDREAVKTLLILSIILIVVALVLMLVLSQALLPR
ncbi:MAG: DUF131 domain-containing protein [Candidatus Bathyarchaeia archaeon]